MSILEGFRIFFGSVFIIFLPGLAWSYVFFAKKSIDWVERVALSVGLSIVLVPLVVFWLNLLFGMGVTLLNISLVVCILIALAFVWPQGQRRPLWTSVPARTKLWLGLERWSLNSATALSQASSLRRLPRVGVFTRAKSGLRLERRSLNSAIALSRANSLRRLPRVNVFSRVKSWFRSEL